ncbi:hormogonium polysaccharide biosynthesis protein HpsA [Aphanizomenon sp. CS-733/32]|uniref:hormogonium polysaccharide biosynthesis protein HpsA n=1 Tax=Aphanizomenon sp. CS-733/32 TaxID=3021715 RepID=UPI00232E76D9|nr:hormogonium polysaccharide biosynthesis protein HpsA [Aphanizomenon sp. CS-733/32]MDB9308352.1 hormogonium polysaccharide biosynthesis protein HpsA [Aphanizomenon sp. CS-733/32]
MSRKRQPLKKITSISTRFIRRFLATTKRQIIWLLRTVFGTQKQQQSANAGFVLPTVAMVSIVVVLLTTAIMFRSFDRAKIASNVRVNQVAMNSAAPAIDRARAKLKKLFDDNRLARATPTEAGLDGVLVTYKDEYTFGDEKNLTINCIDPSISNGLNAGVCASTAGKELKTAWQFPVDTDNNGKFDSYTLYGIYYENPDLNSTNTQYKVKRNPIQARTTPMTFTSIGGNCGASKVTSASLVGVNGWFKGNKSLRLVKAFFVYTVTVPITSTTTIPSGTSSNYEVKTGNRSFSALEYEQDKVQQSLINNAVVYQDDLGLTPGVDFRLNGRIFTNANFLTGSGSANIRIYQVSSPNSCFYEADNAKITVGGNISNGGFTGGVTRYTSFDLFPGKGNTPSSSSTPSTVISLNGNQSVTDSSTDVAYNNLAYTQRVNRLVAAQIAAYPNNTDGTGAIQTSDPSEVQQGIQQRKNASGLSSYTDAQIAQYRSEQLQLYFQKRTRRVPFKEVAFDGDALGSYASTSPLQGSGDSLRPIDAWSYPTSPTDGKTGTSYTGLTLNTSGTGLIPSATEPTLLLKNAKEKYLGDRIQIGHNLPQLWWKASESKFVGPEPSDTQSISGINWTEPTSPAENRYRLSQIQTLADVGSTDRDGDWELDAAKVPENPQDPVGGLRVITGAGIYLRSGDTAATTSFTGASTTVWSDMMPIPNSVISAKTTQRPYSMYDNGLAFTIPTPSADTPFLKMRATAVYHYKQTGYSQTAPTPIACVSSFYDPTNSTTARNSSSLAAATNWTPPTGFGGGGTGGLSNNGIVYGPPTKSVTDYQNLLTYQSTLRYANGRSIDDGLLAGALAKTAANRTLSERSAIDAAICALQILDGSISPSDTVIPHGAIFETAFLDGRQVKAVHSDDTTTTADERFVNVDSGANPSTNYDLPLQDRQPIEIRATVLDLGKLRKTIGGTTPSQEYLIPNSGIIYATRDDALVDKTSSNTDKTANKLESSVDYKLDPTRRPNAIILANGSNISRETDYRDAEKGLIVATNLPAYIKGDFNLHSGEEFTAALNDTWSNFYTRSTLNSNFACRPKDLRLSVNGVDQCPTGDTWRTAAVISDAMTLLSNNYRFGFRNEGDYDWNNNSSNPASLRSFPPASGINTNGTNTNFQFNTYAPKTPSFSGTSTNGFESQFNTSTTSDCSAVSGNCSGYYGWRVGDLDSGVSGNQGSSYLFNFVTPVVRQIRIRDAKDYGYEVCDTDTYTDCNSPTGDPKHWVMTNVAYNGSGSGQSNWGTGGQDIVGQPVNSIKTGTMGNPPANGWDNPNFLRRVAFRRNPSTGALVTPLRVYGTNSSGQIGLFDPASTSSMNSMAVAGGTDDRLIPALQLDSNGQWKPVLWNAISNFGVSTNENNASPWLQSATSTTYNIIIAAGDTPARTTEDNGGLHNYVRFAEIWSGVNAKISGSFMQLRKSSYATAPFATSLTTADTSLNYATNNGGNKLPFYQPPIRLWGYDVGILSQSPDRFSQKLVVPVGDLPNEYFREVGRDDPWVQNLLCAKDDANTSYVIDQNQRPSICQS